MDLSSDLTAIFFVLVTQLAGYGLGFLAVFELGFTGRTWKRLTGWYESKNDSLLMTIGVWLTFPITIFLFLCFMSLGGFGFAMGSGKAAQIQAQKTGEDYLGQHDDWLERYLDNIRPILAADDYSYKGRIPSPESWLDYRASVRGRGRQEIYVTEEEADRAEAEKFKGWLEQIKSDEEDKGQR